MTEAHLKASRTIGEYSYETKGTRIVLILKLEFVNFPADLSLRKDSNLGLYGPHTNIKGMIYEMSWLEPGVYGLISGKIVYKFESEVELHKKIQGSSTFSKLLKTYA